MLCKHHFSKNGQVFFHIFWVVTLIMQSRELDTVVGPRGHSKAVLLTLIDRKSRFLWAYRLKDRTTATVNEALTKFLTTFNGPVHSFTVDRRTEFSGLVSLESQYGIKVYYCHAYTPAERGSNERFNRNLRYFYPKGTRFEHISAQDLTTTLLQINQRPLKILDWQTPYQVMLTNLSKNSD